MNFKSLLFYLSLLLICSCTSVQKYNAQIEQEISVDKLKKDVNFVQKKLKRYHPKLDWYIPKHEIDFKFDSFKKSINKAQKPNDFYVQLSSIFRSLGHGHTDLYPLFKKLDNKQKKRYKESKSAFYNYGFLVENDSIFLVKDYSKENQIKSGSKLLYVDSLSTSQILNKYKKTIYGDGYNKTFENNLFNRSFLNFVTLEENVKDSVLLTFQENGKLVTKKSFRIYPSPKPKVVEAKKDTVTKVSKVIERQVKLKQKRYGYNKTTRKYSKELLFPTNDSTVALLKVNDFRKGKTKELYKSVFSDIKKHKVKNLVIDLRDNGGGYVNDAHYLYSYLVKDSKQFIGDKIVASKTSFGQSILKFSPKISYPVLWLVSLYTTLVTTQNDQNEYELHVPFSRVKIEEDLVYNGNLYVIINGGSYSASSLISTNLQANKRAFFVGEETGGDFNGTVAGLMPKFKLPNSKLTMSVGTVYLSPLEIRQEIGRGIFPNKEIKPTLKSKIKNQDVELIWILNDIKQNNSAFKMVLD